MAKVVRTVITAEPTEPPPLLLDDLIALAHEHGITEHEKQRLEERGIGFFEAMAAIAEPDFTRPGQGDTTIYTRGDIEVVVGGNGNVVTVIDRFANTRPKDKPRQPLGPEQVAARVPRSQALDEAWALGEHDEPDVRLMYVTPPFAQKLLLLNQDNRPLRERQVDAFAATARAGNWRGAGPGGKSKLMHQGIAIDRRRILQDGQHRLTMIVDTGIGVWMPVYVGLDPENYAVVDTGRVRNYADVLAKARLSDPNVLGSVARMVRLFLSSDKTLLSSYLRTKVTNDEVLATVLEDVDGFKTAVTIGHQVEKGAKGATRTGAAAAYYVICRVNDPLEVTKWFHGLADSDLLPLGPDPRKRFRESMAGRDRKKRASGPEHMALIIKAWNAWVEGRELKALAMRRDESMPPVAKLRKEDINAEAAA